jgi:hypothetical protein
MYADVNCQTADLVSNRGSTASDDTLLDGGASASHGCISVVAAVRMIGACVQMQLVGCCFYLGGSWRSRGMFPGEVVPTELC